jgi:formylglycine-generating enzyme required for sulfatase activity
MLFMKRLFVIFLLLHIFLFSGCTSNRETEQLQPSAAADPAVYPEIKGMVLIPAGPFSMGSDADPAISPADEKPAHTVLLDAFYIDTYEVTNAQYQRFLLATGRPAPFVDRPWAEPYNWKGTDYPAGKENYPVVLVSWEDAQAYAAWISKRLPTEAEWEKASRAQLIGRKYPYGDTLENNRANFDKGFLRENKLKPVGSFEPSRVGLYDMAGNVWEWCQDWYDDTYYKNSPAQNPRGPAAGKYRVCRGGSWVNDEQYLRCAQRGKNTPDSKSHITGFRCALSAKPGKKKPE